MEAFRLILTSSFALTQPCGKTETRGTGKPAPGALQHGGRRDGRVPVLTLPQHRFDVGAAKGWQIQQNRLVEMALGRAQAPALPWTVCGTAINDKMEKADSAAERCYF